VAELDENPFWSFIRWSSGGIIIREIIKFYFYWITVMFISQVAISTLREREIDWVTFLALSVGGIFGIFIHSKLKKSIGKDTN
jgi:hypothetical protein